MFPRRKQGLLHENGTGPGNTALSAPHFPPSARNRINLRIRMRSAPYGHHRHTVQRGQVHVRGIHAHRIAQAAYNTQFFAQAVFACYYF